MYTHTEVGGFKGLLTITNLNVNLEKPSDSIQMTISKNEMHFLKKLIENKNK